MFQVFDLDFSNIFNFRLVLLHCCLFKYFLFPTVHSFKKQKTCRVWSLMTWTYLWRRRGRSGSPSCWAGPSPCSCTPQRPPAGRWSASACRCFQTLAAGGWRGAARRFCTILWSSRGNQWHGSEQRRPARRWLWCFSLDGCWRGLKSERDWEMTLLLRWNMCDCCCCCR